MFNHQELAVIRQATKDKSYLDTSEAQKAWDAGAEDALRQSKE